MHSFCQSYHDSYFFLLSFAISFFGLISVGGQGQTKAINRAIKIVSIHTRSLVSTPPTDKQTNTVSKQASRWNCSLWPHVYTHRCTISPSIHSHFNSLLSSASVHPSSTVCLSVRQSVRQTGPCHQKIYDRRFLSYRFSFLFFLVDAFIRILAHWRFHFHALLLLLLEEEEEDAFAFQWDERCSFNRPNSNLPLSALARCWLFGFSTRTCFKFLIFEATYLNSGREWGRGLQDKKKKMERNGMNTQQKEKKIEREKKGTERHGGCVGWREPNGGGEARWRIHMRRHVPVPLARLGSC